MHWVVLLAWLQPMLSRRLRNMLVGLLRRIMPTRNAQQRELKQAAMDVVLMGDDNGQVVADGAHLDEVGIDPVTGDIWVIESGRVGRDIHTSYLAR